MQDEAVKILHYAWSVALLFRNPLAVIKKNNRNPHDCMHNVIFILPMEHCMLYSMCSIDTIIIIIANYKI